MFKFWISCIFLIPLLYFITSSDSRIIRAKLLSNTPCTREEFRCFNNDCKPRRYYCDGDNDCSDSSDELFCSSKSYCPGQPSLLSCARNGRGKCYPSHWHCDGQRDCPNGEDEINCGNEHSESHLEEFANATDGVKKWLANQRHLEWPIQKWGSHVSRVAVVWFFTQDSFIEEDLLLNSTLKDEIMYELSMNFLSKLALRRLQGISSFELASHINAFLITCIDPRQFHMIDLVQELRSRVDTQNFTDPFGLLTLCNAQEFITGEDVDTLRNEFQKAKSEFQTETQAMIVLALSCASSQPESTTNRTELHDMTLELKKLQHPNGTIDNLKTTALVMQALIAADSLSDDETFKEYEAFQAILNSQGNDGSFWDFTTTYYVAPVLQYSSLANISSTHCKNLAKVENERLQYLKKYTSLKKTVTYSLWFGEDKFVQKTLKFQVPANSSLYTIMEYASELDEIYRFKYNIREGKPYIFSISEIMDDPEKQLFWRPYFESSESDRKLKLISNSPSEVIPENNARLIYWYSKLT